MKTRIALLLLAVLLVAACAPAVAAVPAWTPEEVTYLGVLKEPGRNLELTFLRAFSQDYAGADTIAARQAFDDIADAFPPATLAVVGYYAYRLHAPCTNALSDKQSVASYQTCMGEIASMRLELARLYAARGLYPPTPAP